MQVWSLGQEDPPGEGNGNPLQYSCLGNPMDRGAWQATVHGVAKSRTRLSDWTEVNWASIIVLLGLPRWQGAKESSCQCRRHGFDSWVGKSRWRRKWLPTPVFLPGKSHGPMSLAGYSQWCHKRVRHDLVTEQQYQLGLWINGFLLLLCMN